MSPIIYGVFAVFGLVFLIIGITSRNRAKAAQSWPTISGVVFTSRVDIHTSTDNNGSTSTTYRPIVDYKYVIMGQEYSSNRIAFGSNTYNRKKSDEIISRYPLNQQVVVHYNPEKPQDAVLETQAEGGILSLILGIILLGIGVVLLVTSFLPK